MSFLIRDRSYREGEEGENNIHNNMLYIIYIYDICIYHIHAHLCTVFLSLTFGFILNHDILKHCFITRKGRHVRDFIKLLSTR